MLINTFGIIIKLNPKAFVIQLLHLILLFGLLWLITEFIPNVKV